MSKELTDAWKAGKLKSGWYWVKTPIALGEKPAFLCDDNNFDVDRTIYPNNYDLEVLSSCDYEELQQLKEENKALQEKLDIAVKALKFYKIPFHQFSSVYNIAQHHKRAEEVLEKIKEIK